MKKETAELVRSIGVPPRPHNRVQSAIAGTRQTLTKTITTKETPAQGFFDRFFNGTRPPTVTTTVVPLSDIEIIERELEKQRIGADSARIDRADELDVARHFGDIKEQEVRSLKYEAIASRERIEIVNLHYEFDAAQRLWPEKEAAALASIQTEQVRAQTELVKAQNEHLKALREQAALQPVDVREALPPARRAFGQGKSDDVLRNLAQSYTNRAVIGSVEPKTGDDRWLPRAGATFIERYMRTNDRELAVTDTYQSVLHNLRLENAGEIVMDMDQARGEYQHFLDLEDQARQLGVLDKARNTFESYNRPGGADVFTRPNVTPIDIETAKRR
jgi:hypothetical protein